MRYSLDLELPGMLHGAIVRSHSPHAVITGVELPGGPPEGCVLLTGADVADCVPYGCLVPDTPVLAATARYAGDPVAAVAAPDPHLARALRGPSRSPGAIFPRRRTSRPPSPRAHP
jgi:xanthine dehydrogenase YagR molybdenum-binding subunit